MLIGHGPLTAIFLILVAVLALFDLAFQTKKPPAATDEAENDQ